MRAWQVGLVAILACEPSGPVKKVQTAEGTASSADAVPAANEVAVLRGVPDRARDPAVVALSVAGQTVCSGVLVSPRLVLTARHCVRKGSAFACPAAGPQVQDPVVPDDVVALVGEDASTARNVARGIEIIEPDGDCFCAADIAVVALDNDVGGVKPLPIRGVGAVAGEELRSIGFVDDEKTLREHVDVLSVSGAEFSLAEATCLGGAGGPALDEDTGEVVGIAARDGDCGQARNVYTRVDVFAALLDQAFARIADIVAAETGAPAKPAKRGVKARPPVDLGGPCATGDDCGTGLCITDGTGSGSKPGYCSLRCETGERCPTHYHCDDLTGLPEGARACIDAR